MESIQACIKYKSPEKESLTEGAAVIAVVTRSHGLPVTRTRDTRNRLGKTTRNWDGSGTT